MERGKFALAQEPRFCFFKVKTLSLQKYPRVRLTKQYGLRLENY